MKRPGVRAQALAAVAFTLLIIAGGLAPGVAAQGPDKSNVVLVFDFSASILNDKANRNRFGAALESIANRVDATTKDLVRGDTTVSMVEFATHAVDVRGCTDLKLLANPESVSRFANCVRAVAAAYRKGATSRVLGIDTNYVAAMQQAARHLPAPAERPALILFTDGRHDVAGVPASQVIPARDALFGGLPSFALLPVGMGLDPKLSGALKTGLENLRVVRNIPACAAGGPPFEWPQVVFQTPDAAGNAVGLALQGATCTFTVAPTPKPTPAPTPAPVRGVKLTPGDGKIDVAWSAPASAKPPVTDYQVRCGTGDGTWIASQEGVSTGLTATVTGLTNGTSYQCQVAVIGASTTGAWTPAAATATPFGRPSPPPKPTVQALDGALTIAVPPIETGVDQVQYECSADNGATWTAKGDASGENPATQISGLANGTEYLCRAYSMNAVGLSDASPVSDSVRPCGSALQCNPLMLPILSGLGALLAIAILIAVLALLRGRPTGYVIAVIDVVHTANIGHGARLGIAFTRDPATKRITGIVADRGKTADVNIRRLRDGGFEVVDRSGTHRVADGDPLVVADDVGVKHSLVLRGFATNAASSVASRR